MSKFTRLLKERMDKRGFPIDDCRLVQFDIYQQELKNWNAKINLTSLTDDLDVIDNHIIDSLALFRFESLEHSIKVADVGAGAGFPGLAIKIYQPDVQLLLLESTGKKVRFLEHIVAELGLENVAVVNDRAEVAARSPEHREQYDLVTARAVARLPTLVEYCLPLVSIGGKFVAYKGQEAEIEVEEAKAALEKLGGRLEKIERNVWTDERVLVFMKKVKKTPDKYPRRPGVPRKKPL